MKINLKEYEAISKIIFWSFFINITSIILFNFKAIDIFLFEYFNIIFIEALHQFFYGALSATIACSLFMAKDKETNELESVKEKPDPSILMLPDCIDRKLYIQRIISSGLLAIVGMMLLLAGFSYLEVNFETTFTFKQKMFFGISSSLIGLYQINFIEKLRKVFDAFYKSKAK
jgi:hypothetical protein